MANGSKIEWTDATWNIVTGCTLVSEGCRHCYAATLAATRLKHTPSRAGLARINAAGEAKFTGEVRFNEGWLDQPLRWRKPRRVFVCAHGYLFHEAVPDDWIDRVFAVMALAPQHTFQVLTKRPERMLSYIAATKDSVPRQVRVAGELYWLDLTESLPNVWLGVSVEDQATADARIPPLLATPAAKRFISAEPLLGNVDVTPYLFIYTHEDEAYLDHCLDSSPLPFRDPATTPAADIAVPLLDWVIAGGESGPGARPMHPDWPRALRDQCSAAGVPFFFKQWGEWAGEMMRRSDWSLYQNGTFTGCWDHVWEDGVRALRVGKKAAGASLDEREHREFPA